MRLSDNYRGRGRIPIAGLAIAIAMAVLMSSGAAIWGETPDDTGQALGDAAPSPLGGVVPVGALSTPGASGSFTMNPGMIYRIEITSGSGGNSTDGKSGGQGAVIVAWFDMRGAEGPVTFNYSILSGGAGGWYSGGWAGGSGGYAVFVKDQYGNAMMVAGGGGGGPANGSGGGSAGLPGNNASNAAGLSTYAGKGGTLTAGGLGGSGAVSGGNGGGIGDGKGGAGGASADTYPGGGGGSGYTGGGGGGGVTTGGAGGGGGGTSYVHPSLKIESAKLGNGPIPVKVSEYVSEKDIQLHASDASAIYDGGQHGIDAPSLFPTAFASKITIKYSGNGYESTVPPVNAGTYSVTATIDLGTYGTYTSEATLTIYPALLAKPTVSENEYDYTGYEQTLGMEGYDPDTMFVSGHIATDEGTYIAIISLIDPYNYHWDDGTGADGGIGAVTIDWSISEPAGTSGGDDDDGTGSDDDGTGSDDDGTGSDDDGTGSDDDGTGSDDDGTGSDDDGTGTDDDGTGSDDDGTGSDDDGTGSDDDGTGSDDDGTGTDDDGTGSDDDGTGTDDDGTGSDDDGTGTDDDGTGSDDEDGTDDDENGPVYVEDITRGAGPGTADHDDIKISGVTTHSWALIAAFLGMSLFMLFAMRRSAAVTGTVTHNGRGVANASVTCTVDGKRHVATTDVNGKYVIFVQKGSDVVITSAAKGGLEAKEMPVSLVAEKRTRLNIAL